MNDIVTSLIYLFVSCIVLIIAKGVYVRLLKYDMYKEIRLENYTAVVPYCGFLLGNAAILAGAFIGPDSQGTFLKELIYYLLYAVLGIGLTLFSGFVAEKLILHKFNNTDEIVRDRNLGTAAVYFGIYLASGLIISACVTGETLAGQPKWYGLVSTLVYYALGMIFLVLFSKLHDKLSPYSLLGEIEEDNAAVGISFAGNIIAIGLILMRATVGDLADWQTGLISYFIDITAIILLLPAVRILLDRILVKGVNIAQEVKNNNVAAGLGEAFVIVAFAIMIFFMVDFTGMV